MSTSLPRPPAKCDCRTPIWRWIDGTWKCLNCQLHDAIHLYRNDRMRDEIMALIEAAPNPHVWK
jgi:hypothetical protein